MRPVRLLPSLPRMLARGLTRRCPRCGTGNLFPRWLTMVEVCPGCGLQFDGKSGGLVDAWLGSITINMAVSFTMIVVSMIAGLLLMWPDVPAFKLTVALMLFNGAFAVFFQPFSKTTWTAVELFLRSSEPEDLAGLDA